VELHRTNLHMGLTTASISLNNIQNTTASTFVYKQQHSVEEHRTQQHTFVHKQQHSVGDTPNASEHGAHHIRSARCITSPWLRLSDANVRPFSSDSCFP
jgi:hypothetical protein